MTDKVVNLTEYQFKKLVERFVGPDGKIFNEEALVEAILAFLRKKKCRVV